MLSAGENQTATIRQVGPYTAAFPPDDALFGTVVGGDYAGEIVGPCGTASQSTVIPDRFEKEDMANVREAAGLGRDAIFLCAGATKPGLYGIMNDYRDLVAETYSCSDLGEVPGSWMAHYLPLVDTQCSIFDDTVSPENPFESGLTIGAGFAVAAEALHRLTGHGSLMKRVLGAFTGNGTPPPPAGPVGGGRAKRAHARARTARAKAPKAGRGLKRGAKKVLKKAGRGHIALKILAYVGIGALYLFDSSEAEAYELATNDGNAIMVTHEATPYKYVNVPHLNSKGKKVIISEPVFSYASDYAGQFYDRKERERSANVGDACTGEGAFCYIGGFVVEEVVGNLSELLGVGNAY